jgi:hypothetical protein
MLFRFDVVTNEDLVTDPEGSEFTHLEAAVEEATQSARDLAAAELLAGRSFPGGWKIQIVDRFGNARATVLFASLILDGTPFAMASSAACTNGPPPSTHPGFAEQYLKTLSLFEQTRSLAARVRATFEDMKKDIAAV